MKNQEQELDYLSDLAQPYLQDREYQIEEQELIERYEMLQSVKNKRIAAGVSLTGLIRKDLDSELWEDLYDLRTCYFQKYLNKQMIRGEILDKYQTKFLIEQEERIIKNGLTAHPIDINLDSLPF